MKREHISLVILFYLMIKSRSFSNALGKSSSLEISKECMDFVNRGCFGADYDYTQNEQKIDLKSHFCWEFYVESLKQHHNDLVWFHHSPSENPGMLRYKLKLKPLDEEGMFQLLPEGYKPTEKFKLLNQPLLVTTLEPSQVSVVTLLSSDHKSHVLFS